MIIKHFNDNPNCLSHQVLPALEQGWEDTGDKRVHFFFGYPKADLVKKVMKAGEEWWFVDYGYMSAFIDRHPPKIHHYDKTYFRVTKGAWHLNKLLDTDRKRFDVLVDQGVTKHFEGWKYKKNGHILICSSSDLVTKFFTGKIVRDWIESEMFNLKISTGKAVLWRDKPRPNNQWWNRSIAQDLEGAAFVRTLISGAAVDALVLGYPSMVPSYHALAVLGMDPVKNKMPLEDAVTDVLYNLANNQFTIDQMKSGLAYNSMRKYYND